MPVVATCHCGATRLEVDRLPESVTACTCTYCSKTGGLWAYYEPGEVRVLTEAEGRDYCPTGLNHHHFCGRCGCTTHGISPAWTEAHIGGNTIPEESRWGVNARLLDDVDLGAIPVRQIDGRNLW